MSISQEINWDIAKNIAPRLNQSKLQSQQGKHSLQPVSGIQDVLLGFCRRLWPCGLQHAWVFSHADSSLFLFRRCPTPLTSWASSCVYCSLVPTLQTVHIGLPGQLWQGVWTCHTWAGLTAFPPERWCKSSEEHHPLYPAHGAMWIKQVWDVPKPC